MVEYYQYGKKNSIEIKRLMIGGICMIKLFKKIKLPEFLLMNNFKVRTKLIIFFLFISIVPLTIVGLYSYQSAESTIENKVGNYSQELVKQAVVNINSKIKL